MENIKINCPDFIDGFSSKKLEQRPKREFAHDMDAKIIKFLDNQSINYAFRQINEMSADFAYGQVIASGIPVNDRNYSEVNDIVTLCVDILNIKRPNVVVSLSAGTLLNAATFGSDDEPYIILSPMLIKTFNKEQLKFVIGHECGHIAMGHVLYNTVVNTFSLFISQVPIIGSILDKTQTIVLSAWSRRSEISADRAGLLCCKDLEVAQRTLINLEIPFLDAADIDTNDYITKSKSYRGNSILRKLNEYDDSHLITPKRIEALTAFINSSKYYKCIDEIPTTSVYSDEELKDLTEKIAKILD